MALGRERRCDIYHFAYNLVCIPTQVPAVLERRGYL